MKNQSVHKHSGYIESNHIPYAVTSPIGNSFRGPVAKILSPRFQSQRQSRNAGSTVSCHRRAVSHAQGSSKRLYFVQVPEIGVSLPYRHGRERKHRSGEKSIEAPIQRLSISCSYQDIACGQGTSVCYFDLEVRQSHRRERREVPRL